MTEEQNKLADKIQRRLDDEYRAAPIVLSDRDEWPLIVAALRREAATEVVVTTDEAGACVAVTRQNDEGRILKVIWKRLRA